MTVTDVRIPQQRTADHDTITPESQSLSNLRAMLNDPALAGYHEQIRDSIARLQATVVEA